MAHHLCNFPLIAGPKAPLNFVKHSQDEKPCASKMFPEDNSPISESDSSEDDSTMTYARRVTTKKRFKFWDVSMKKNKKKVLSPPNSPLKWPEETVISSDSELEMSMIQMEGKISLEVSESD